MKLTSLFSVVAIVLVAAPTASFAQDTTRAAKDSAKARAAQQSQKTSNGDVAVQTNAAAIVAAIGSPATAVEQIKAAPVAAAVNPRLLDVSSLATGDNGKAFAEALERGKADLPKLQAAIASHVAISAALKASSPPVMAADVVGAEVGKDGAITLYYRHM